MIGIVVEAEAIDSHDLVHGYGHALDDAFFDASPSYNAKSPRGLN